jgi:outer membrane protein OmpA-like peptidoglycan-associated protein
MRSKFFLLGTVAALSVISASNSDAHQQGWYIGLEAGANWIDDNNFSLESDTGFFDGVVGSTEFDTGWAALGTVGYGFANNWRIELEGGYRSNDLTATYSYDVLLSPDWDGYEGPSAKVASKPIWMTVTDSVDGSLEEWTAMINVIYDVPLTETLDLSIGVGAGIDFSNLEVAGVDDSDTNFAYQAIVGLSYAINKRLDLTLTYRYLNVDAPTYSAEVSKDYYAANLEDIEKHTVTVGLRYDLYEDQAPVVVTPPPPPPPAAEPVQYVVFFGFNKCNITAEADAVLTEAASAAKTQGAASVLIVGHTDTVGSDSYNQKLSDCRANAAKSGLVAKGIGEGQISTNGRGETELLVKTGDNVKEPQNRRATIDLKK